MIGVIRYTHWVSLGMKNPRIWVPPTQIQNWSKNFKIGFPGNWTKILISQESAQFTESVSSFWKKIAHINKLCRFPEFNLHMIWYKFFATYLYSKWKQLLDKQNTSKSTTLSVILLFHMTSTDYSSLSTTLLAISGLSYFSLVRSGYKEFNFRKSRF